MGQLSTKQAPSLENWSNVHITIISYHAVWESLKVEKSDKKRGDRAILGRFNGVRRP